MSPYFPAIFDRNEMEALCFFSVVELSEGHILMMSCQFKEDLGDP